MARKKRQEEHENHERWLVSYADFITLLFAFFVVMYSISSVSEGKYRVLSNSLVAAFRSPTRSMEPIQVGELVRTPYTLSPLPANSPTLQKAPPFIIDSLKPLPNIEAEPLEAGGPAKGTALDTIADEVQESLSGLMDEELMAIRKKRSGLEIEIKSKILFGSGSSQMGGSAKKVLRDLAVILGKFPNRIQVEGFTDNVPINSAIFPSNWELSAGRAAAVVRLFSEFGVSPERMTSVGRGEYSPIADNSTPQGRASNRRVVVVVLASAPGQNNVVHDIQSLAEQL